MARPRKDNRKCLGCGIGITVKTAYGAGGDRLQSRCKVCMMYDAKDRYDDPRRGDLSSMEYDELLDKCGSRCRLCRKPGDCALCYKGLYGIYCSWCVRAVTEGPDLLNKALAFIGDGIESGSDVW